MTELDRIYEEIEKLLETSSHLDNFDKKTGIKSKESAQQVVDAINSQDTKGNNWTLYGETKGKYIVKNAAGQLGALEQQGNGYSVHVYKEKGQTPRNIKVYDQSTQSAQPQNTDDEMKLQEAPQQDRDELATDLKNQGYQQQGILKTKPRSELYVNPKTGDEKKIVLDVPNDNVHVENSDGTIELPSSKTGQAANGQSTGTVNNGVPAVANANGTNANQVNQNTQNNGGAPALAAPSGNNGGVPAVANADANGNNAENTQNAQASSNGSGVPDLAAPSGNANDANVGDQSAPANAEVENASDVNGGVPAVANADGTNGEVGADGTSNVNGGVPAVANNNENANDQSASTTEAGTEESEGLLDGEEPAEEIKLSDDPNSLISVDEESAQNAPENEEAQVASNTEAPTEETSAESTEETPTEEATPEVGAETPTKETPTETTETPTEESSVEEPTTEATTEQTAPTEESTTEEAPTEGAEAGTEESTEPTEEAGTTEPTVEEAEAPTEEGAENAESTNAPTTEEASTETAENAESTEAPAEEVSANGENPGQEAIQGEEVDFEDTPLGQQQRQQGQELTTTDNSENLPSTDVLNSNASLNYRLKSVIDSPQIQQQIDAAPSAISYIGLEDGKIVAMAENKVPAEFHIPSFLKKLVEANQISAIGAGDQTNLNVFLTPEIQNYIKSKGNPNITKVMLGKDGMVWLMDDKNNPYSLADMNVNNDVATKDQEGNSFNVFINNGGAGGVTTNGGNGGNGQGTGDNASDGSSNGSEPYGEITQQTTVSELNAIKGKLNERLSGVKDKIESSLSDVNTSLKEVGLQAGLKDIKLSSPVKGTYLQDKQPKSFTIKEAKEEEKDKSEEKESKEPVQTTTGDTEIYVIEEFYIKPLEESTEDETPTEEVPNDDNAQNGGEDIPSDIEESMEKYFLSILKEAQNLLREELEDEGETEQTETPTEGEPVEGEPVEGEPTEEEEPEKTEEELAKEQKEKEEKIKQVKNQSIVNILRVSTAKVVEALNGNNGITLSTKTDDKTTFTGRKTEDVVFTFGPGDESKSGFKVLDEDQGLYKGWFTFIIAKGNSKETGMTKFNRFMNRAVGVADVMNKLAGGTTKAAEV